MSAEAHRDVLLRPCSSLSETSEVALRRGRGIARDPNSSHWLPSSRVPTPVPVWSGAGDHPRPFFCLQLTEVGALISFLPGCRPETLCQSRPHRLVWPRTPAFHAGETGSNPVGETIFRGVAAGSRQPGSSERPGHSRRPISSRTNLTQKMLNRWMKKPWRVGTASR